MPITKMDLSNGWLVQVCAACGLEHVIRFDRGAAETKAGPFALFAGATLEVAIDGAAAQSVKFASTDAKDLGVTSAAELATRLGAGTGALASATALGSVLIESATTGATSRVEVTGGSAMGALGFQAKDAQSGRPILGDHAGPYENTDVIVFRTCGCGSYEMVNRTWDVAPANLAGTPFYEHRRAVNALGQHFKAKGWLHSDLASRFAAEATPPADVLTSTTGIVAVPHGK